VRFWVCTRLMHFTSLYSRGLSSRKLGSLEYFDDDELLPIGVVSFSILVLVIVVLVELSPQ